MPNPNLDHDEVPEAVVVRRREVSLVWFIPLVTLLVGAWLAYKALEEQGVLITIAFPTAESLEAGKTVVRYRDVDVGVVESIELQPDLRGVQVKARMDRSISDYLNEKARFWVVRPRLSAGQISGLSTLVGGAYIAADFYDLNVPAKLDFEGEAIPPVVTSIDHGTGFTLIAERLGSLSEGSPVTFKGIKVGSVMSYDLLEDDRVAVEVFVKEDYASKINSQTRFWTASAIGLDLGPKGVELSGSLGSLLLGGIEFGHYKESSGTPGPQLARYRLFSSEAVAMAKEFRDKEHWQLLFTGSVRGLTVGSPVEFRGIPIGEVDSIELKFDEQADQLLIPVVITVEAARLGIRELASSTERRALWDRWVAKGLRAQLQPSNLLTGAQVVNLDIFSEDETAQIAWEETPPRLPSRDTAVQDLFAMVEKFSNLPLDKVAGDLSGTLGSLSTTLDTTNRLLHKVNDQTTTELQQTLEEARGALTDLRSMMQPNSALQSEAQRVLREFGAAARSMRIMTDYLERHPEALIQGKRN